MSDESNIEKIKKLLRLAKSDNQHESQLAMQRAMELAAKHSVDLADLADGEDVAPDVLTYIWETCPLRVSAEYRYAANIAVGYFHVTCCYGRGRLLFIGRSEDIEIAKSIIAFLIKASRAGLSRFREDEAHHRRRMTPNKRASYLLAFFNAISWRLAGEVTRIQLEHPKFELVLADQEAARKSLLNDVVPSRESRPMPRGPTRRNVTAAIAGHIDGRNTQVMPQIQPAQPAQGMLQLV